MAGPPLGMGMGWQVLLGNGVLLVTCCVLWLCWHVPCYLGNHRTGYSGLEFCGQTACWSGTGRGMGGMSNGTAI